ncbi:MAG: hypothetical protein V3R67_08765 [Thermodesulfobacteriota bacterium]
MTTASTFYVSGDCNTAIEKYLSKVQEQRRIIGLLGEVKRSATLERLLREAIRNEDQIKRMATP